MNTTIDMAVENLILQFLRYLGIRKAHYVADSEHSEEDIRRHAQEWIEANRDTVDPWLEAARSAARRQ